MIRQALVALLLVATASASIVNGVVSVDCSGSVSFLAGVTVHVEVGQSSFLASTDTSGAFSVSLPDSGSASISLSDLPFGVVQMEHFYIALSPGSVALEMSLADAVSLQTPPYYETQCGSVSPSAAGEARSTGYCPASISYVDRSVLTQFYLLTYRDWTLTTGDTTMTALQIIKSQDTEPPVMTVPPPPSNAECNGSVPPPSQQATVTDNCSGGLQAEYIDVVEAGCPVKVTRTWMAADLSGNIVTEVQTFELMDYGAPAFTTDPASYEGSCGQAFDDWFSSFGGAVVVDSCYPSVTLSGSVAQCTNSTIAVFSASDPCGNTVSQQVDIAYTEACDGCS